MDSDAAVGGRRRRTEVQRFFFVFQNEPLDKEMFDQWPASPIIVLVYYVLIVEDASFPIMQKKSDLETAVRSEFNLPRRSFSEPTLHRPDVWRENVNFGAQRNSDSGHCSAGLEVFRLPIR